MLGRDLESRDVGFSATELVPTHERLISAPSHISGHEIMCQAKQVLPLLSAGHFPWSKPTTTSLDRTEVRSGSLWISSRNRSLGGQSWLIQSAKR